MPRLLAERVERSRDSIAKFELAATCRYHEANELANRGLAAGAVYLYGYAAEMVLKSAYFRLLGYTSQQAISLSDLYQAVDFGRKTFGLAFTRRLHDIESWASLLVMQRFRMSRPYGIVNLASTIQFHARTVQLRWREVLRYKVNVPYAHESRSVRFAAGWFISHGHVL